MWLLCKGNLVFHLKLFEIWDCGVHFQLPSLFPLAEFIANYKNPMAKVFGILTAIVLAISALIAFKNKAAYEAKISDKITQIETLTKSQARLGADEELLGQLPSELATVQSEVEKLSSEESTVKKANEVIAEQIKTNSDKLAANKTQLDEIRAKTEKSGNINELAAKLRATSAELSDLAQSITNTEAKLSNITAQNTSAEGMVSTSKSKFENFSSGESLPNLKTRIRSIYPNWGFVTLASGNNAGVVSNSTLNVVRGDEVIAKLLVTAVESGSASASIVPDSLTDDVTLAVGDCVVPAVKAVTKTAAN